MALERLINDIKDESCLITLFPGGDSEAEKDAWKRVGQKNNLSGTEAKSIFEILKKKYKEESKKVTSTWKLLEKLRFLEDDPKTGEMETVPGDAISEEDTYIELLEVKEENYSDEEENTGQKPSASAADDAKSDIKNVSIDLPDAPKNDSAGATTSSERKEPLPVLKGTSKVSKNILKRKITDISAVTNGGPQEKRVATTLAIPTPNSSVKLSEVTKKISTYGAAVTSPPTQSVSSKVRDYTSFGAYIAHTLMTMPKQEAEKLELQLLQTIVEAKDKSCEV